MSLSSRSRVSVRLHEGRQPFVRPSVSAAGSPSISISHDRPQALDVAMAMEISADGGGGDGMGEAFHCKVM